LVVIVKKKLLSDPDKMSKLGVVIETAFAEACEFVKKLGKGFEEINRVDGEI
jgi:hypothetical protein